MKIVMIVGLLLVSSINWASIDAYEFQSLEKEQQFRQIITELRCPKCQNQNISDSNAGLAKDIKDRAYELILAGKSNAEITDYMVDRYGNFITYRPPLTASTYVLWFGPFVLALLALIIFVVVKIRQQNNPPAELKQEQHQQVSQLLKKLEDLEHKR